MNIIKSAFLFICFIAVQQAWACSCAQPPSVKESLKSYDAIFTATVMDIEQEMTFDVSEKGDTLFNFPLSKTITLKVEKTYKTNTGSETLSETIKINTASSSEACGYYFKKGKRYIVYTYKNNKDGMLWTNLCTRTKQYQQEEADELAKLSEK